MSPRNHRPGATAHLSPGDHIPVRVVTSIHGETSSVPLQNGLTHLQFRRFASCPICNLHLRSFVDRHRDLVRAGIHEVVVFHSPVEAMTPHQGDLPFTAIADPDYTMYDEFGIEFSRKSVLHPRAWTTPMKPYAWTVGFREMRSPGGKPFSIRGASMYGHPADFLLEPDGRILAAKYGAHANDQWSVDDVLRIAEHTTSGHH